MRKDAFSRTITLPLTALWLMSAAFGGFSPPLLAGPEPHNAPPVSTPTLDLLRRAKPPQAVDQNALPGWFKSAEKIKQLLGGKAPGIVSDPRVIRREASPIEGMQTLVVEATVTPPDGGPTRQELFVFYTDARGQYLVVGMLIDMDSGENVSQTTLRAVRGEIADHPGLALSPLSMHAVSRPGIGAFAQDPVLVVIDLAREEARANLLRIANVQRELFDTHEDVRALYVIPVTEADNELSVGAMAMALGYDVMSQDGFEKLMEYAKDGAQAPWLSKERLANDPGLKQAMGMGIFRLDDNSQQALLARVNSLPLVYRLVDGTAGLIPTPTDRASWEALFTAKLIRRSTDE